MAKVLTIQPHPSDTTIIDQSPTAGSTTNLLTWLQEQVGGRVEIVSGDGWAVVVNEDGRSLGLPANPVASEVMHQLGRDVGVLVGPAVFIGADEYDDVPDVVVETAAEFVVFDWQA